MKDFESCKKQILLMLKRSQTKVIFPMITLGLVLDFKEKQNSNFSNSEIRKCYHNAVEFMKEYLGHDFHLGGKYYDAYPSRNLPKYGVLKVLGNKQYEFITPFKDTIEDLSKWIPEAIKEHIDKKLGIVPKLSDRNLRAQLTEDEKEFISLIERHINKNPTNFEIFSFAIIKVHLEKFACKIYRDTKTSATDKGVDLATNFGVVYQIKKMKINNTSKADILYSELKSNFDKDRMKDGNIVIIIDDITKEVKKYLINMKIQSISKQDLIKLVKQFDEVEDKEKVLRIVYEEFRREYSSDI